MSLVQGNEIANNINITVAMHVVKCHMANGWGLGSGTRELPITNTKTLPSECTLSTGGPIY